MNVQEGSTSGEQLVHVQLDAAWDSNRGYLQGEELKHVVHKTTIISAQPLARQSQDGGCAFLLKCAGARRSHPTLWEALRADRAIVMTAVSQYGLALRDAHIDLQNDPEIVKAKQELLALLLHRRGFGTLKR